MNQLTGFYVRVTLACNGLILCHWFFIYSLKTSEKQRFSDVSRGYRKRSMIWNGLKDHKMMWKHFETICEFFGIFLHYWAGGERIILTEIHNCGALRDFVRFIQFRKREKHPSRSDTFSKTLLKVSLLHGCFLRFSANGTKSRKILPFILLQVKYWMMINKSLNIKSTQLKILSL